MPISEKILEEIDNIDESNRFKKLLIELLEAEDKGSYKNNQKFEQLIKEYIDEMYNGDNE